MPALPLSRRCSRAPGREEPQLPCAFNGGRATARVELGVDVADVRVDRVDGDVELSRDLRPRHVGRQVSQDAQLAWAELLRLRQGLSVGARGPYALQHVDDVGEKGP